MPNAAMPVGVNLPDTYIGPPHDAIAIKGKSRDKFCHRTSETMSTVDRINIGNTIPTKTAQETAEVKDEIQFIASYQEMIEDHIERRVAVLFQQLVISYETHLHFEIGKTQHQAESAKTLYIKDHLGKKNVLCKRNAAHSSTLPCIIAYESKAWNKHVNNDDPKPDGFVYVQGGDVYRTANSTLDMPRAVNEADIEIDGEKGTGLARDFAIDLLNRSARGEIDPTSAIQEFLHTVTVITQDKIPKTKRGKGVKKSLQIFLEAFKDIQTRIETVPEALDQLLGVQVAEDHQNTAIQTKIYHLRYKAIRDNQYAQTAMISKINTVRDQVLKVVGPKRKPTYFEDAFRNILCSEMRMDYDKKRIYKLFNSPQEQYFRETAYRKSRYEGTKAKIVQQQLKPIQVLARVIGQDLRALKREEILKRGLVTRELRNSMGWTQTKLATKIKAIYQDTAASQPTISRIETNIKLVDKVYAEQLADVFDVDQALLMPAFFYG
jgi:hypothetical protein